MAKPEKVVEAKGKNGAEPGVEITPVEVKRRKVGIMRNGFRLSTPVAPQYWHQSSQCFKKGQVIWSEEDIDKLISLDAPIEVFYQDGANGTAENRY